MAPNSTLYTGLSQTVTARPAVVQSVNPMFYGLVLEAAIVLVVLGNTLVILALLSYRRHWTATDVFLFSLSTADFLDSFVALQLIAVVKYFLHKPMNKPLCDVFVVLVYAFRTASATTVTFMAVERSLLLVWPIKHHTTITPTKIKKIILGVWLFSFVTGALPLIGFGNSGFHENECYYQLYDLGLEYAVFIEVFGAVMMSIVLLSYFAAKLAGSRFIKRQLVMMAPASASVREANRTTSRDSSRTRSNSQVKVSSGVQGVRRLTVMMALVVVIYYISWLPFLLSNLASLVIGQRPSLKLSLFTSLISMLHGLSNPVLYGWMSQRYRRAYVFVFNMILTTCGGKRPSRRSLSVSRKFSVATPVQSTSHRMSVANKNLGFQADEVDCKSGESEENDNVELKKSAMNRQGIPDIQNDEAAAVLELLDSINAQFDETIDTTL